MATSAANGLYPIVIDIDMDDEIDIDPPQHELVADEPPDYSFIVSQILEIVPDVDPEHALSLVKVHHPQQQDNAVQTILHLLFEDSSYPKADVKGKRKRASSTPCDNDRGTPRIKIDYGTTERPVPGNPKYAEQALVLLQAAHPFIPKPHVRKSFNQNHSLFAPTWLYLNQEAQMKPLPYVPKRMGFRPPKGKDILIDEIEEEHEWIRVQEQDKRIKDDATVAAQLNTDEYQSLDAGIECGCCFDKLPFEQMIQCTEGHLFCNECMRGFAETKLGGHDANISCMDQSGCKELFPVSELRRFLTDKLFALYERVKQRKEIEAAGLDDLEECPFCDYKCVIDNPDERLFRCGNEEGGCGAVTCRSCKKPDHLPKSCQEMDEDKKLHGLHHVEEAMTEALMRKCPGCQHPFIKEAGCNKMSCPNCHALSCYSCRQLIHGYEHFDQRPFDPAAAASSSRSQKCLLSEPVERRHDEEVKLAAQQAREEYKRDNPDAEEENLQVELPQTAVARPQGGNGMAGFPEWLGIVGHQPMNIHNAPRPIARIPRRQVGRRRR